jgi:hypothetical protein
MAIYVTWPCNKHDKYSIFENYMVNLHDLVNVKWWSKKDDPSEHVISRHWHERLGELEDVVERWGKMRRDHYGIWRIVALVVWSFKEQKKLENSIVR